LPACHDQSDGQGQQAGSLLATWMRSPALTILPAIRVRASTTREDGEATFLLGDFHRLLDQGPWNAVLAKAFWVSSASLPSVVTIAFCTALTKASRRWSRFWTSDWIAQRISLRASWTFAVCFRENSMTSRRVPDNHDSGTRPGTKKVSFPPSGCRPRCSRRRIRGRRLRRRSRSSRPGR